MQWGGTTVLQRYEFEAMLKLNRLNPSRDKKQETMSASGEMCQTKGGVNIWTAVAMGNEFAIEVSIQSLKSFDSLPMSACCFLRHHGQISSNLQIYCAHQPFAGFTYSARIPAEEEGWEDKKTFLFTLSKKTINSAVVRKWNCVHVLKENVFWHIGHHQPNKQSVTLHI